MQFPDESQHGSRRPTRARVRVLRSIVAVALMLGTGGWTASAQAMVRSSSTPAVPASSGHAQVTHTAVASPSPVAPETTLSAVQAIVDRASNAKQYSARDRERIALDLTRMGKQLSTFVATHPELFTSSGEAVISPSFSVGVGRFIYLHHVTPRDQRWMLQAGTGVLAAAICAASAGTACSAAAAIAAATIPAVSEYFSPTYCLEMQFWYWGALHKAYRTRC